MIIKRNLKKMRMINMQDNEMFFWFSLALIGLATLIAVLEYNNIENILLFEEFRNCRSQCTELGYATSNFGTEDGETICACRNDYCNPETIYGG